MATPIAELVMLAAAARNALWNTTYDGAAVRVTACHHDVRFEIRSGPWAGLGIHVDVIGRHERTGAMVVRAYPPAGQVWCAAYRERFGAAMAAAVLASIEAA